MASFSPFIIPGSGVFSRRAAFCRSFNSFTSCASRVLRVSAARFRLFSPAAGFVCPMMFFLLSSGVPGSVHRISPARRARQCALLWGHCVFLRIYYPNRIFCSFKVQRICVSFIFPVGAARRKRPLVFRVLPTKTFAAPLPLYHYKGTVPPHPESKHFSRPVLFFPSGKSV